jgi:hypothetical protein
MDFLVDGDRRLSAIVKTATLCGWRDTTKKLIPILEVSVLGERLENNFMIRELCLLLYTAPVYSLLLVKSW